MPSFDEDSPGFAVALSVLLVVTGSLNTIAAKWADSIEVEGVLFDHPFFQTTCMFFGEFCCLIAFFALHTYRRLRWDKQRAVGEGGAVFDIDDVEEPIIPKFNWLVFMAPACCDIIATSLQYVGLNMTTASSYQMLRGSIIIFTGLLSVAFLRARLAGFKWLGMVCVVIGLSVVGISSIYYDDPKEDTNAIITGDLLIIMAQIIAAIQMVTEQKVLTKYDVPPLMAVGLEGLFGMTILSFLMIPMYFVHVSPTFSKNPELRLEDVIFAFKEIGEKPIIAVALLSTIVSIAFFNFAGIWVTKRMSATTRMVLDSVRTLIIWMFSIPFFGEKFIPLQLLGFAMLILGMFVYNDIVVGPWVRRCVLPRMSGESPVTLWCLSCWSNDDQLVYQRADREGLISDDGSHDGDA